MTTQKHRVFAMFMSVILMLNLIDGRIMQECWNVLKAYAAASDYSVGYYWETKGLGDNNGTDRSYSLSNNDTVLTLTEKENEDPVLRSTFYFNLARAIEPGKLKFTITGLDDLIRNGTLTMNMNDPNLVGTWEITKDAASDTYTFVNKVRVTSNNETTFTWQFNSRDAINGSDIELKTAVSVTEVITTTRTDPDTGETIVEKKDGATINLDTNSLVFKYNSVHDDNQVKIVCKDINDTDFNNLNADYDWRCYSTMLGLSGMTEYTLNPSKGGVLYTGSNQEYEAHAVVQDSTTQDESLRSRGIKTSDYFIEVDPGEFSRSDLMVVNASGSRVDLGEYVVNGVTRYGFYDFRGGGNRLPGQSYTSDYRVGVKNSAITGTDKHIKLTGHYLVTYNDEQNPVDYTDTAAHLLSQEDKQPVGNGNYIYKFNDYEINNGTLYSHHWYDSHARHYSGVHQLLYDQIFNGKVVTYNLTSRTSRAEQINDGKVEAIEYDLIYEDGAPSITNLLGETLTRTLRYDEYDFQRVLVKKLVDGNTVTLNDEELRGFDYEVYVISHDPNALEYQTWTLFGSGNTVKDSEVYLPSGIDEIKLVVRNLTIRADVTAFVDIAYTVDEADYDNIYIDTEHLYENDNTVDGAVRENTNKGTKLVNTFNRKRIVGDYDISQADTYTYSPNDSAFSNTWLRDSVTNISASAEMEPFTYHAVTGVGASNYYSTTIKAGGTIESDTQKALKKFAVYSRVPEYVTPSEDWLQEFKNTLTFSGTLLGGSTSVDADFVFDNNALSVYFDEDSHCIVANFDFDGFALDSREETSIQFSYPAEITLMQFNALELPSKSFETDTYVTILDDNVRVAAEQGLLLPTDANNPTGEEAVKDAAFQPINALGSQKSNYTEKYVSSYYTKWVYDNSAEVDGNNAEHLDRQTGRMTSDYSYKLIFHRFSTDTGEQVTDPILLDVVDGVQTSSWHGYVKSVTFDGAKSYLDYEPEVYYRLRNDSGVSADTNAEYKFTYNVVDNAISQLTKYGVDAATAGNNYSDDLNVYETLKNDVKNWHQAIKSDGNTYIINRDDVYAIAIIYKGTHAVGETKEMELTAYLNMNAPALSNDGDEANNNRATYNDVHAFAKGYNSAVGTDFPIYSISDQTMVTLRHNVELMKVSSTKKDKRLSGAEFTVYKGNTTGTINADENIVQYYEKGASMPVPMEDMTVDLTGVLQLNLAPGIYYYKETLAPVGYQLDPSLYRFRAVSDENSVYYYSIDLKTADELNNEYLIVNKKTEYDAYSGTVYSGKTPVANTDTFHVYSNNTDGTKTQIGYLVYDAERGYYAYNLANGSPADVDLHCNNGLVTVAALDAGSYFIGKTENDADGYSFSVADNSEISFMIFKKSVVTDAKYYLKEMLGSEVSANDPIMEFASNANGVYSYSGAGSVQEIVPDSNGKISITGLDDSKTYYFVNTEAPTGYKLVSAQIAATSGGEVVLYAAEQLEKTNKLVVEDDPIDTAKAKFQKIDNTVFNNTTDSILPLNGAVYHMYFIEEDGSESLQYFLYNSVSGTYQLKGSIGTSSYTSNLTSQTVSGTDGMLCVEGLGYGTYALEEITAPTSYQLNQNKIYFYVMASTIEEKSGDAYARFADETSNSGETTDTMLLKDNEVLSSIILSKADASNTDFYLGNAAYDLYRLKANTDATVSEADYLAAAQNASTSSLGITETGVFPTYWEKVSDNHYYTNSSGELTINRLPFGTYLLYEFLPPVGYKWNNDLGKWETWQYVDGVNTTDDLHQQIIVIDKDTVKHNSTPTNVAVADANGNEPDSADWTPTYQTVPTYHAFYAKHIDERKEGEARLIKRNKDNIGLSDGVFALYQVNLTNAEIAGVLGKTEAEVTAMTAAEKQTALSKKELQVSDIDISNHFDTATGKPKTVSDVTIDTAIDQNMSTNGDVSTRGATKTVSGLEWGIYYFYEVKAPSGYQKNNTPYVFAVNSDSVGTLIEIDATDDKTYGEVWLYKQAKDASGTNLDEHTKLFGAQFDLFNTNNEKVYSIPRLRLGGLNQSAPGVSSNKGRKEFLVKEINIKSKTELEFIILDDDEVRTEYIVTANYEESNDGKITSLAVTGTGFMDKYGSGYNSTYEENGETKNYKDEFRLAYYVISSDANSYYDDSKKCYVEFAKDPGTLEEYKSSATTTEEEAKLTAEWHQKEAEYDLTQTIKHCITSTYITADEGGRLNVRGLDWDSYYFRETVPPEGYGLAEDVVFTVNAYNCDNQFLPCEDPVAEAAIIVDKEIPDASYFDAYGDPTFLFKVYQLEQFSQEDTDANLTPDYTSNSIKYKKTGKEYTLSVHLSDPNTTGSAMVNVPVGQYLIEELPVSRYVCTGLEMIAGTHGTDDKFKTVGITTPTSYLLYNYASKYDINTESGDNQWTAFCDLTGGDSTFGEVLAFHVKYTNEIERYDNFSHVSYADNRIPEREYITAFKPMSNELIEVYSGTDTSHEYVIDLGAKLTGGVFEGVLTYNTGRTAELTAADLSKIQFNTSSSSPVTNVEWDSTTGILKVTVDNPSTLAGSAISLDVGYSEVTPFTAYNINNTNMVRGTLNLTFSEIKADKVKKLILKNDVANKSYFLETDNTTKDSSVAVIYTQDADTPATIAKTMQNPAQTDTLTMMDGYVFSYWYLLDADGRPLTDKNGDVIQFADENEIKAYMFSGTWPAYLTTGNLVPDTVTNPASVANVNSFTFQANVEEIKQRPLTARVILNTKDALNESGILGIKNAGRVSGKITGVTSSTITAFKEGNEAGWDSCDDNHRLTYDSYAGNYTSGSPYPDYVRFYAIGTEVYWYTVDRETLLPTNGTVYLVQTETNYANTPNLFQNYTMLSDVSGMFDWDFSGMNMFGYMFQNTAITEFTLNRQIKKTGLMYLSRMFHNCKQLTSVTMSVDTSEAGDGTVNGPSDTYVSAQTKQMFFGCEKLTTLNLSGDFSNLFNAQEMFNGCKALTASEFKRAFSTWTWNTNSNMQTSGNNKGDQIFLSYTNVGNLQGVDLVDANGNHFKRDNNVIIFDRAAD